MGYKLTVDQPHLGDEGTVYIHGLGTFQNGKTYLVSDELALNFETINAVDKGEIDSDSESETFGSYIPKVSSGSPLDVAAESMYGITVTKDGGTPPTGNSTAGTNNGTPDTGADTNGGDQ